MKNRLFILAVCSSVLLYSCKDIIETDLSKNSLVNLVPSNNYVSSSFSQTFRWDELDGATKYKLQIVQPNFASPWVYSLDTTISKNSFTVSLFPGIYQWRVRAINGSSFTEYITYNLTIDSSLDLHNQKVVLSSPGNNTTTNTFTKNFSWQTLPNADSYIFQILSAGSPIETKSLTATSYTYAFTAEGTFAWKVTAQNSNSTSQPSDAWAVNIDTTKPAMPTPVFPVFDTIHANPIPLKWNIAAATSVLDSANYCRLQISTDSTFVVIDKKDTLLTASANPMIYNLYGTSAGQKYFWRVKTTDEATNASDYFPARRIKVK